jgi:AraC-like DNA-binding protein
MTNQMTAPRFETWQSQQHFNLDAPWEHVGFAVFATYDVVARPGWRISAARQPLTELWLVREGTVEIEQNGRTSIAAAPCVAVLRAGQSRDTRQRGESALSILGFSFSATLWGALDVFDFLPLPPVFSVPTSRLEGLLEQMVDESRRRDRGYSLAVQGLGQLALVEMWRAQDGEGETAWNHVQRAQSAEMTAALNLIAARYGEPIDVAQLARAAHLSTKYFGRKFRAALGIPPMEYVRRIRLDRARDLLAGGDASVAHIARQCGFDSGAHFSRAFRAHWGASPLEFRRSVRETMHLQGSKSALAVKTS